MFTDLLPGNYSILVLNLRLGDVFAYLRALARMYSVSGKK